MKFEKYEKYIEEISKELKLKKDSDINDIAYTEHLQNTFKIIDQKIKENCKDQLQNIQQYIKPDKNRQPIPIPGKEKEFSISMNNLQKCSGEYGGMAMGLKNLLQISDYVIKYQLENCISDSITDNEEKSKKGIKDCLENTYKYTNKSFQKIISEYLSVVDEKINKL